jgi:hypothetical protein
MSEAETQKVIEFIKTLDAEKVDEMELDSAVHDTAATIASDVNNGGVESQVEFLLKNGWTVETLIGYIKAEY